MLQVKKRLKMIILGYQADPSMLSVNGNNQACSLGDAVLLPFVVLWVYMSLRDELRGDSVSPSF